MVLQRNIEGAADVGKFRRPDIPEPPREAHGAEIFVKNGRLVAPFTARCKDATVKRGVMRGNKIDPVKQRRYFGPEFPEVGLIGNIIPGDSMQPGELKGVPRGSDERIVFPDYVAFFRHHQCNCTGAVAAVVGGLEVDGDETVEVDGRCCFL